eukprot:6163322-Prymnesium_polylepis.1
MSLTGQAPARAASAACCSAARRCCVRPRSCRLRTRDSFHASPRVISNASVSGTKMPPPLLPFAARRAW